MSKKTFYILGILLTILIGTLLYSHYCCKCKSVGKVVTTGNEIVNNFALTGNGFNYHCGDNFKFPINGFDPVLPVGDSINPGIKLLKDNFDSNPAQKLVITGYCTSAEVNNTSFANLGFARANALKNYFIAQGIPAACIDIFGVIKDGLFMKDKFVFGPADFKLSQTETKPGQMVLNFNSGQTQINLSAEQKQAVTDIAKYLAKVTTAKLDITGYTDNFGDRAANIRLGKARADFARACFVKNGVAESRIECASKGPDDPVADNSTADGKAKNRRTVIVIK